MLLFPSKLKFSTTIASCQPPPSARLVANLILSALLRTETSNTYTKQVISLSGTNFGSSVAIDRTFSGGKPLPVVGSPSSSQTSGGYAFALSSPTGVGQWTFGTSISGSETEGFSVAVSAGTVISGDEQSTITIWCSNVN